MEVPEILPLPYKNATIISQLQTQNHFLLMPRYTGSTVYILQTSGRYVKGSAVAQRAKNPRGISTTPLPIHPNRNSTPLGPHRVHTEPPVTNTHIHTLLSPKERIFALFRYVLPSSLGALRSQGRQRRRAGSLGA